MVIIGGFITGGFITDPSIFVLPVVSDISMTLIKRFFSLAISIAKESKSLGAKKINNALVDAWLTSLLGIKIKRGISSITDSEITLTNNETKDIMNVIKSLENKGILLKETTTKITSQERRFLNFLRPFVTAGLPLMESALLH